MIVNWLLVTFLPLIVIIALYYLNKLLGEFFGGWDSDIEKFIEKHLSKRKGGRYD